MRKETFENNVKSVIGFDYENYGDIYMCNNIPPIWSGYSKETGWSLETILRDISNRLQKLELLTKANDYRLQAERKPELVKKSK